MTALNRLETLFPKEMFGCIIGEKGARIKEVREKNGVQINNDKDVTRGGYRAIRFEGDWCAMWNAFCEVVKTISEGRDERAFQNQEINCDKFTVQIKIPRAIAGQLIGQKGANLNEWRAKWADCAFHVEEEPGDQLVRYFTMKGHPYTMCEASVAVADVIEIALQKNANGRPNQNRGNNPAAQQQQGGNNRRQALDLGGGNNANKRQTSGDSIDSVLAGGMMTAGNMGEFGFPHMNPIGNGGGGGLDASNPFGALNGVAGNDDMKRRRTERDASIISGDGSTPQTMSCTCQLMVDDTAASKIIGKQGAVIKSIRHASKCEVHTDRQGDKPDGNREIQVIGSLSGIQVALSMISNQILLSQSGQPPH